MRAYDFYDVKNNPDVDELTEYNKSNMTIVFPDNEIKPPNPNGLLCRHYGCQMVAMEFQNVDNYLMENTEFFDRTGFAFSLKPANLRYEPIVIPDPIPQNPDYYYAPRTVKSQYYNYNI
jgi:hypothetical protein